MYNEIITYYSRNPVNKGKLEDYDIKFQEENRTCWDDLKVYIKIKDNKVNAWWFKWDTAIMTTACASIFWESIIWMELGEVLKCDYNYIEKLVWMPISDKRKQAAVLWLLTTRNAIHLYLEDWKKDKFEDLIK